MSQYLNLFTSCWKYSIIKMYNKKYHYDHSCLHTAVNTLISATWCVQHTELTVNGQWDVRCKVRRIYQICCKEPNIISTSYIRIRPNSVYPNTLFKWAGSNSERLRNVRVHVRSIHMHTICTLGTNPCRWNRWLGSSVYMKATGQTCVYTTGIVFTTTTWCHVLQHHGVITARRSDWLFTWSIFPHQIDH